MADENARRDDNGAPSILFASGPGKTGETRRVHPGQPLPVDDFFFQTETLELPTNGTQAIVTPSPGKRICVKGVVINPAAGANGEAYVSFQTSGKLIHKVFRAGGSGNPVKLNLLGAVDEPVNGTSVPVGLRCFFSINYVEVS